MSDPDFLPRAVYRPEGHAAEYAEWAGNLYSGCGIVRTTTVFLMRSSWRAPRLMLGHEKSALSPSYAA